jgi:hypothetical protein
MIINLMEEPVTLTPDKKESRGIPKIEVKAPSLKKRSKPLPWGRYLPPMAPLTAQLAPPSHLTSTSLSTLPTIIDLTEEPVTLTSDKKESRGIPEIEVKAPCYGSTLTIDQQGCLVSL